MENNHVQHGIIESINGEQNFTPVSIPENGFPNETCLRTLIDNLKLKGWKNVSTDCGSTGYMDEFGDDESNGYGYDEHGRAFVQVKIVVDGFHGMIRVFERYTDKNTVLVSSGKGVGSQIFGSALDGEEFALFYNFVMKGDAFRQTEKYMTRRIVLPAIFDEFHRVVLPEDFGIEKAVEATTQYLMSISDENELLEDLSKKISIDQR